MNIQPSQASFLDELNRTDKGFLWAQEKVFYNPPDAFEALKQDNQYCFLLESVKDGDRMDRYSVIGLDVDKLFKVKNGKVFLGDAHNKPNKLDGNPLTHLQELIDESQLDTPPFLPKMASGIFGYLGYDMVRYIENLPLPSNKKDLLDLPESIFLRPKLIVVLDSVGQTAYFCCSIFRKDKDKNQDVQNHKDKGNDENQDKKLTDKKATNKALYQTAKQHIEKAQNLCSQLASPSISTSFQPATLSHQTKSHQTKSHQTTLHQTESCQTKSHQTASHQTESHQRESRQRESHQKTLRKPLETLSQTSPQMSSSTPSQTTSHTFAKTPYKPDSNQIKIKSNMTKETYYDIVRKAKNYITQGEALQIVLSQQFSCPFHLPPFTFYRHLRKINPAPYLFFFQFDDFYVVSASPERLVGLENGTINIRPIAGTRKRGANNKEDDALIKDLLSDKKELAEHLMLLDLGRNDVGRMAEIGSVKVKQKFDIQKTSQLIHIVSSVVGTLKKGKTALDALMAAFPAGTVSGAPKVRSMQLIDELEPQKRGVYAGCIGYFTSYGEMDNCIALRTALIKDETLYVQAGGGIVYDSKPENEYEETKNKAKGLFLAAKASLKNHNQ